MLKKVIHLECIYTELPFYERFAAARADGFDTVEMWDWNNKDLPRVKELLAQNGLTLAAMSGDGPLSMCDPATKDAYIDFIKQSLNAAKFLDCKTLVIHSDALEEWPQYAKPLSGAYSQLTRYLTMYQVLTAIAPMAEEAGVTFVLEALNTVKDHCGNFLASTADSCDLVAAVNSPNLKILYDSYHMYLNEGKICETAEKYLPYIGHIHIADAPGRNEPGTGVLNFTAFMRHLDRLGYDRTVGFEFYPATDTPTAIKAVWAACEGV